MTRPDIIGDAQRIKDVIVDGGVAILQGDVGYGLLTAMTLSVTFRPSRHIPVTRQKSAGSSADGR